MRPDLAPDLDTAARNPDGSYNGIKALEWMSEVLTGRRITLTEEDIAKARAMAEERRNARGG